jgi:hypothetical protein
MLHMSESLKSHLCESRKSHLCESLLSHLCESLMSHLCGMRATLAHQKCNSQHSHSTAARAYRLQTFVGTLQCAAD